MNCLWLTPVLIIGMVACSLTRAYTVSPLDSSQDVPSTRRSTDSDGKRPYWEPDFHPVNNIYIDKGCDSSSVNHSAIDNLLNMTRTILDLLQSPEPSSAPEGANLNLSCLHDSGNPRDCSEIQANGINISGVYAIYPDGPGDPFFVYCDMKTDGGGWTVFQLRQDGSVDFFLYWSDYKYGFGSVSAEHWLGNDKIHRLATQKTYELRVDLEDFDEQTRYASYNSFYITDEVSNYVLTVGDYLGDAGDSLSIHHSGHPFTTRDNDNDNLGYNCAVVYTGAWWYNECHYSNINGQYLNGTTTEYGKGVVWRQWLGHYYSLKKTEMKIRPV